ncbi:fatty acid desaturase [Aquibium sp. A9E412]|uniref:fatty acid desaturase n=1 Tax=Aquibium sp. A9E412 TaxID=2976767 RepID=UPI0025AEF41A|nr:fatty acid desaturase [Aquibium sp. A9E412]MDN2568026.1 fatty acid desaturase [Aquibium sp. A9E412]
MGEGAGRAPAGGAVRVEWPTVGLIVACYGLWATAGVALWPAWPAAALAVMSLCVALQSSLMHECLHGHPTRHARLNEALVGLPIGLVYPYRRFKALHLRHHADERLTDPFEDPESYYRAQWRYARLPGAVRLLLRANNTMVGRFVLGPPVAVAGFLAADAQRLGAGDRTVRRAWLLHGAGVAATLAIVAWGFGMPVWLYLLVPVWLGQSLIAIRTFAEHRWAERPDGRTIIVERSPFALLFLNNNLHLVHHKRPRAPWYRLPALYRAQREMWLTMNDGYAYPGYFALFRAFALRPKEPVAHPVLRRAPEPGRAYRPRVRAHSVAGLGGTAPVPARPQKD